MNSRLRNILIGLVALLVIGGGAYLAANALFGDGEDGPDEGNGQATPVVVDEGGIRLETAGGGAAVMSEGGEPRLRIRLSRGEAQPQQAEALPLAAGTPLPPEAIETILSRLPTLSPRRGDTMALNLPDELLPPPRPGETVAQPFPPPATPVAVEPVVEGPLEVLRFAPEGEIGLAPFLNVTFNQPMVPLNTVEALTQEEVPVQLTPALPGTWRWLGTKTLSFEYQSEEIDRFPMATEYVAEIPAGTESAVGGVLPETVTWKFRTPPPQLEQSYPNGDAQPRDPIFFTAFDQRIEPAAVLETVRVNAGGDPVAIRPATQQEIEADEAVSRMVENALEGRWLAFRAEQTLPGDTAVTVTIGPGTPSAEGPLTTEAEQRYEFRTYGELRIEEHRCGWGDECAPFTPFFIRFSNPLEGEAFTEDMLQIEPEIPGVVAGIYGREITIRGATQGRTTYEVTVAGNVQDIYGQTLGEAETLRFRVGSAPPQLSGPNQNLVTLDPSAETPRLTVYSINYERLEVDAYAVSPADWPAYQQYLENFYRQEEPPTPPGRQVLDETVPVESVADKLTETNIDLSEALDGETGHLIVVVQPPRRLLSLDRSRPPVIRAWVQVTGVGLDAFVDQDEMVAWATDLASGAPLSGVALSLGSAEATTGGDGVARLALPEAGAGILVGREGDDVAILPGSPHYWNENEWQPRPAEDELRWYVWDDRQMYRPGEEVHVKGWLRRIGGGPQGDVGLAGVEQANYLVRGPQGNEFESGQVAVNALGGFDLAFTLPENANLGQATLELRIAGSSDVRMGRDFYHGFQIQEFRRPEFEVTARQETEGPYYVGDAATVAVKAAYYAGGPLPNAEVGWQVTSTPASYSPPDWPDFIFGTWQPWWAFGPTMEGGYAVEAEFGMPIEPYPGPEQTVETFSGTTDAAGEHYLNLDFEAADEPRPFSVRAQATVMDVNRQAWAADTNLLVHPAELYVGLRSERTFVQKGTPLEIELIVTDVDGNAVSGQAIDVEAARLEWRFTRGQWGEEEVDVQTCTVTSGAEPVNCTFSTEQGGTYRITATVTDGEGRQNQSQFERWVSGGRQPQRRNVEQEEVLLVPDKEEYRPGETAEILVQAPFSPAEGLLTVSRSGILYTERFNLEAGSTTLRVPIEEAHVPTLHVQVDLVGSAARTGDDGEALPDLPARPAYARGNLSLNVPPYNRTLAVEVTPQEEAVAPGAETAIDVLVTAANGEPVGDAEVALVVVDEAILALSDYQLADPLAVFYRDRGPGISSYYGRESVVLANPELLATVEVEGEMVQATRMMAEDTAAMEAPVMAEAEEAMMDEGAAPAGNEAQAPQPIQVRTNFNPLAIFAPEVRTGADGRATVQVSLPDNLTRYRVMAVAVAGEKDFGKGESNLRARLPLMVRPSAPRFLNFGDRFGLPVVIQNQTDEEMTVDVVVQAVNVELPEGNGRRVTVPANDRVEVRFPATTALPGTAHLQFAAVSGDYADAATISLPVYTPATTEAFATYGVLDEGVVAQPVAAPEGVFRQFGGLEINTSSTALQALTDAVLYLVNYRYECSEQLASRILAVAALRDVLTAFEAEGMPTPAEMEAALQRDLERLQGMQNGDGGFPIWRRGAESIPFYSIHVTHALVRAQEKGFEVPAGMVQQGLNHLREIESYYPPYYSKRTQQTLSAYALYVRYLAGESDPQKALRLYNDAGLEELSLEAVAWLWPVLEQGGYQAEVEAIGRHFDNRAVETAGAANFTTSYGEDEYLLLHSDRRTDGVILESLITVRPESDLIPKVVNGLLAHRTRGRWSNTQENVFILLALDHYFNTFEAETPDFVARIWLGETYAGAHQFEGRTTERRETEVPMSYLVDAAAGETQDLILSKEGPGRLYYRLGLRYAPDDLELEPLDMGFVVERVYEAVDDEADVRRDADGTWHIRAGARVRVKLKMVADNRRYHVALVDPLPAGLEIVNPALAVSEDTPTDPQEQGYRWWWWWTWYDHQNMRDERAEAFATLLWEGVYDYEYVARATTPGTFVVPPAKAEEMYSPEVFGRSASDLVIVE